MKNGWDDVLSDIRLGCPGYGCTTIVGDGKKTIYDFNHETGILKVSMNSRNLKSLVSMVGQIPESGKDIILPTPLEYGYVATFKGVKKIKSIKGLEENEYMLGREFLEKIKSHLN
jgi:hypothetical protein